MNKEIKTMARMPCDIHDWFRRYAKKNNRSMNGQLIAILQEIREQQRNRSQATRALDGLHVRAHGERVLETELLSGGLS